MQQFFLNKTNVKLIKFYKEVKLKILITTEKFRKQLHNTYNILKSQN